MEMSRDELILVALFELATHGAFLTNGRTDMITNLQTPRS